MSSRNFLNILCLVLLFTSCNATSEKPTEQQAFQKELDSLFEQHQYFEVRRRLSDQSIQMERIPELILKAKMHSVFNEREESNAAISLLLKDFGKDLSEQQKLALLETQITNSVFLYEYAQALKATSQVLSLNSLSDGLRKDHLNTQIIYTSLQEAPSQEVFLNPTKLPITKDIAGLPRIPVGLNHFEQAVVFDTGANFSVITDSLAKKAGVKILGEVFKVKAVTGGEVDSQIGVMDSLILGNSLLRNVVFLVFPEASLRFPEANYSIEAILGFPVINALGEIQLVKQKEFIITGKSSEPAHKNLALDFLTPIVEVHEGSTSLPFSFDTGANSTDLYQPYFRLRKDKILSEGTTDSLRFGGAGGVISTAVYYIPFSGKIGESAFQLDSTAVHEEDFREYPGIYGNLGQDILSQFDTLTMNFQTMSFNVR